MGILASMPGFIPTLRYMVIRKLMDRPTVPSETVALMWLSTAGTDPSARNKAGM